LLCPVSTRDQNLARQLKQLKSAEVNKIFQKKISGKDTERSQLQKVLNYLRDDDEVIGVRLDR
jgi:DNA invertase Pin-like site-specific DNA recombinase